jgi:hypothetical protein
MGMKLDHSYYRKNKWEYLKTVQYYVKYIRSFSKQGVQKNMWICKRERERHRKKRPHNEQLHNFYSSPDILGRSNKGCDQ